MKKAGLKVSDVAAAVKGADFVIMLMPDEHIAAVYREEVEPNMRKHATLAFAHGFNIHYGQVQPRADLDVVMIAPKAPGHTVRSTYVAGGGTGGGTTTLTESFKVSKNTWKTLAPLPQATLVPGSAVYKGQLYCFGGLNPSGSPINTVQIYQP